jgi:Zn-dependent protease with chaperone function
MVAAIRAGVSVLMLAGFYVVALAQLAGAVALAVWLGSVLTGAIAVKLVFPLFAATVGAVGVALWKAIRAKPEPPRGLPVGPDEAPALWSTVRQLAEEVGTRVPDEIRLIPDINAAVVEQSRLLGLVGGRRFLYMGLPLLQVMTVDQLRSVLAHELGHYSRRHTRLGAVAYRGRIAIAETLNRIGPHNVAGWIFKAYANLYVLVDNAVVRRQEYEADQASVRVAGRAAAVSALRELPVLDAAWGFYFGNYVVPGWEAGYAPADLFGGFAALVAVRTAELEKLRAEEPQREGSKWDTHPPIPDRIAAISASPEAWVPQDGRAAAVLLPDPVAAGRRMQELMVDVGRREVLPWPRFTHAWLSAQLQREADEVFRTIARRTGVTELNLGSVFDLIAAGRLGEIAEPFFPDATRREAGQLFADVLELLMRLAAVQSGAAGWQHSWSGPAQFVNVHGYPLSLTEEAKLAVAPGGLDEAYRRLRDMGIDITRARLVEQRASAVGAGVIAGLANVKVNDVEFDLLVLDRGLVFVPDPGKSDGGTRRLQELVGSAPAQELAERHHFVPYEEVRSATITKRVPARVELALHDGRTLAVYETWGSELIAKDSRDVLLAVLTRLNQE